MLLMIANSLGVNYGLMILILEVIGFIFVGYFASRCTDRNKAYIFAVGFMFVINFLTPYKADENLVVRLVIYPVLGFVVAVVCYGKKEKADKDVEIIAIETDRYSTLIKRIFDEYNENVEIIIDGVCYKETAIPELLDWWCKNEIIMKTRDFVVRRDGVDIFGFHDMPDDFLAAVSELDFVAKLADENIVRYRVIVNGKW